MLIQREYFNTWIIVIYTLLLHDAHSNDACIRALIMAQAAGDNVLSDAGTVSRLSG